MVNVFKDVDDAEAEEAYRYGHLLPPSYMDPSDDEVWVRHLHSRQRKTSHADRAHDAWIESILDRCSVEDLRETRKIALDDRYGRTAADGGRRHALLWHATLGEIRENLWYSLDPDTTKRCVEALDQLDKTIRATEVAGEIPTWLKENAEFMLALTRAQFLDGPLADLPNDDAFLDNLQWFKECHRAYQLTEAMREPIPLLDTQQLCSMGQAERELAVVKQGERLAKLYRQFKPLVDPLAATRSPLQGKLEAFANGVMRAFYFAYALGDSQTARLKELGDAGRVLYEYYSRDRHIGVKKIEMAVRQLEAV